MFHTSPKEGPKRSATLKQKPTAPPDAQNPNLHYEVKKTAYMQSHCSKVDESFVDFVEQDSDSVDNSNVEYSQIMGTIIGQANV